MENKELYFRLSLSIAPAFPTAKAVTYSPSQAATGLGSACCAACASIL